MDMCLLGRFLSSHRHIIAEVYTAIRRKGWQRKTRRETGSEREKESRSQPRVIGENDRRERILSVIEWYNDNHGYTLGNGDQKVWSATVTEIFHFNDGFEPRVELRYDKTSADGTFSRKGASVSGSMPGPVSLTLMSIRCPPSFISLAEAKERTEIKQP